MRRRTVDTTSQTAQAWALGCVHADLRSRNAALYFPRLRAPDPLKNGVVRHVCRPAARWPGSTRAPTPSAASGRRRPALTRRIVGATGLTYTLTDGENGVLNPLGLNCLRTFPVYGTVCWGARTGRGADALADEYKYIPVRRLALFLEESLYRGTQWAVFEPNDEPLWAQIRLNLGAFMHTLFRQGAFQGTHAARGLLRQVRQGDDDPERHRPRPREHRRRLRAAEAGRVRDHPDPADRRRDPDLSVEEDRPMAKFTVNPQRFDPYKNFKFRVKFGTGHYVAGVSKISALKRTTEMVEHREGGDPSSSHKSPGRTKYEPITMERGVTHDPEFEAWANKVWNFGNAQAPPSSGPRRSRSRTSAGTSRSTSSTRPARRSSRTRSIRAWVSEFTAQTDLDANANAILIQSIKIEHEGWERDVSVREPAEPQFEDAGA